MKVKIKKMKLQNFKGIRELEIDFDGNDTNISGRNASGKTSIFDAFTWLFFDKDSSGSAKFDVKTKAPNGEFIHNLEHSVEAVLDIDGAETSFKKVLKEKYTKQRGATTAVFSGHTTDFFVDDVPRKKKEFDEIVNNTFDAYIFPIITDPFFFNEKMKWNDRRKMLIDICGDIPDASIIASQSEFEPLAAYLSNKTINDLRTQLKAQMKPINDELKMIPVKINEAQLAIPNDIEDSSEIDSKYSELKKEIEELEFKKHLAMTSASNEEKEVMIAKLRGRRVLIEDEIPDIKKEQNEVMKLEYDQRRLEREIEDITYNISSLERRCEENEARRAELRKEYMNVNSTQYDESQNVCPTCGQELPFQQIEGFKEQFNLKKAERLEQINKQGIAMKKEFGEYQEKISKSKVKLQTRQMELGSIKFNIESLEKQIESKKSEFNEKKIPKIQKIDEEIERLQKEIASNDNSKEVDAIRNQINEKRAALAEIEQMIAKRNLAQVQTARIKTLEDQEKKLVVEYSEKEKLLYLTDEFIKAKVEMLTEQINSHFEMVKFKLFDEQINGGVVECCECTYKGVTYSNLNNAAKINCGLDIINTICKSRDAYAPIFIDNAESVNHTLHTDSQQIRLYVTNDETLVIK